MSRSPRTRRLPRSRGTSVYEKPPMSLDRLVGRLEERGLQIPDRDRALRYLRHIGYYRLSPYTIPFQRDRVDHLLRPGTTFDDVLDLYVFDRSLRLHVMDALEGVEVAIRAAITDHMATSYGDAHWYTSMQHFSDAERHARFLTDVRKGVSRQLEGTPEPRSVRDDADEQSELVFRSALEHYLLTYGTPELPPSWVVIESLTIGQLDVLYRNIRRRADRAAISATVGLTEPVLDSWLRTFVRVRNICAHHGRLWNVGLGVYPVIPRSASVSWLDGEDALPAGSEKRLYPVLVSLQALLDVISPRSRWPVRLKELVDPRPAMNLRGMGMPAEWANDHFWSRHFES